MAKTNPFVRAINYYKNGFKNEPGNLNPDMATEVSSVSKPDKIKNRLGVNTSAFYAFVTHYIHQEKGIEQPKSYLVTFLADDVIAMFTVSGKKAGFLNSIDFKSTDKNMLARQIAAVAANAVYINKDGDISNATEVRVKGEKTFAFKLMQNGYDPLTVYKYKNEITFDAFESCILSFLEHKKLIRINKDLTKSSKDASIIQVEKAKTEPSDVIKNEDITEQDSSKKGSVEEEDTRESLSAEPAMKDDEPIDLVFKEPINGFIVNTPSGALSVPSSISEQFSLLKIIETALITNDLPNKDVLSTYLGEAWASLFYQLRKSMKTYGFDVIFDYKTKRMNITSSSDEVLKLASGMEPVPDSFYNNTIRVDKASTFVGSFVNILNSNAKLVNVKATSEKSPLGHYLFLRPVLEVYTSSAFLSEIALASRTNQDFLLKDLNAFVMKWSHKGSWVKALPYNYDCLFSVHTYLFPILKQDKALLALADYLSPNDYWVTLVTRAFHRAAQPDINLANRTEVKYVDISHFFVKGLGLMSQFILTSEPQRLSIVTKDNIVALAEDFAVNIPLDGGKLVGLKEAKGSIPDGGFIWGVGLANPFGATMAYNIKDDDLMSGDFVYQEEAPWYIKAKDAVVTLVTAPVKAVTDKIQEVTNSDTSVVKPIKKGFNLGTELSSAALSNEQLRAIAQIFQDNGIDVTELMSPAISGASDRVKFNLKGTSL